jgi:hypothetical protein
MSLDLNPRSTEYETEVRVLLNRLSRYVLTVYSTCKGKAVSALNYAPRHEDVCGVEV